MYNTSRQKIDFPAVTSSARDSPALQNVDITRMLNQQSVCMPPAIPNKYTYLISLHISGSDLIVFDFSLNFNFQSNVGTWLQHMMHFTRRQLLRVYTSLSKPGRN